MSKHKPSDETFSNSTIIEALCELHFSCAGETSEDKWQGKWFARFLAQLGIDDYEMEPKSTGVQIQISPSGLSTSPSGLSKITSKSVDAGHMIYRHKKESHLFQLTPWKLTINEVKKYPGWDVFLNHIQRSWACLTNVVESIGLSRVGMRYINKIPRSSQEETIKEWIQDTGLVPREILNQKSNFFQRCELQKSEDTKLLLTLAEEKSSTPSDIIFDIDMVRVKNFEPDWSSLSVELGLMHAGIREVFDSSRTERYTKFLKREIV